MQEIKDIQFVGLTKEQLFGIAEENFEKYLNGRKDKNKSLFKKSLLQLNKKRKNKAQKNRRNKLVDRLFKVVKAENIVEDIDLFITVFPYNSPVMTAKYILQLQNFKSEEEQRIYSAILNNNVYPNETNRLLESGGLQGRNKILKTFREIADTAKKANLFIHGFTKGSAKFWVNTTYADRHIKNGISNKDKAWAHRHGFTATTVKCLNINSSNYKEFISEKEYYFNSDINGIFRKWINDKITAQKVLKPFREYFPEYYYHIYYKFDELVVISLKSNCENTKASVEDIIELIKEKGKVMLRRCQGEKRIKISCEGGKFFISDGEVSQEELIKFIIKRRGFCVVTEYVSSENTSLPLSDEQGDCLHLRVFNKYGNNPELGNVYVKFSGRDKYKDLISKDEEIADDGIGEENNKNNNTFVIVDKDKGKYEDTLILTNNEVVKKKHRLLEGYVPNFDKIVATVKDICNFIPEIEYMGVNIIPTENSFKIVEFENYPAYIPFEKLDDNLAKFIKAKTEMKKKRFKKLSVRWKKFSLLTEKTWWKILSSLFARPGFRPLTYRKWRRTRNADLYSFNGISLKDKFWAYKHGFLSYRIPQYGITKENYKEFIPDYDFRWLRQINNKYRTWCEDKITLKYILSKYNQFFPAYYYHICYRNGELCIIRLMDCPEYCTSDFDSVFRLVEQKGSLSLKPQSGSQGKGFYRFTYENGKYYLNFEETTKENVIKILSDADAQYLVTEYIIQHPMVSDIYSGSVNTLRMIVFKNDGITPKIGNTYMRIGSSETGTVDNVSQGGMVAQVDIETGRLFNGRMIHNNIITPCEVHPDTGTKIEGYLPNWNMVKEYILELARLMPQLEFLGFDVAITEDGFKIPEINRSPDYPKIEDYSRDTIDYLISKSNHKKKALNIKK